MLELGFVHGPGRLLNTGDWVVFTSDTNPELFELFDNPATSVKSVAAYIVAHDFEVPAFVALDLSQKSMMLFGDIDLEVDGETLEGSAASTWIERSLDEEARASLGIFSEPDGVLERGWVAAGAFALGPRARKDGTTARNDIAAAPAELTTSNDEATPEQPSDLEEPEPASPAAGPAPEIDAEDASEELVDQSSEEWDPLADPDVDLEKIGVVEFVEASPPDASPSSTSMNEEPSARGSDNSDVAPGDDNFVPDDTVDSAEPAPEEAPLPPPPSPVGLVPPPPTGGVIPPPPVPEYVPGPLDSKSAPTISAPATPPPPQPPAAGDFSLRFDDGQSVEVRAGAYVGRHPTKNGLPDRYRSVTIRGEHVSRVHWELAVEHGVAIIRDLGSNSGTEVETNGRRIAVPAGGMQIAPGATVHFADRWARFEAE